MNETTESVRVTQNYTHQANRMRKEASEGTPKTGAEDLAGWRENQSLELEHPPHHHLRPYNRYEELNCRLEVRIYPVLYCLCCIEFRCLCHHAATC